MKLAKVLFQVVALLLITSIANSQTPNAAKRITPIGVGDVAPDFTLEDQNRHKVTMSESKGKSPVVLVFYRGYW